ncbi:TetR family transcriptional regulator [Nocardioides sp. CER19]|uniref:TetR/AcrR family transcriptional regulator n=1 Tax=Nocardioides sp. CER19 TaxID=3038538 RepID=UPI002449AFBA|nr:TetR family transcriptional regulator [Nocardioides sp. CER19]MDH2413609.1 TetR family transcriptional regulator [Nocardioides sp. CER19]
MTAARPRRFDPQRRQRIIDAALAVIAEHGLAHTTHRLIAARADVPLGSLTYHFTGLDDLCRQAFEQHASRLSEVYAAHFARVSGHDGFVDAVTDLITGNAGADQDDWAVALELYLAALRDPSLRELTQRWMEASRDTLQRFVSPGAAVGLDALVEGMVIHRLLGTDAPSGDHVRELVDRLCPSGE